MSSLRFLSIFFDVFFLISCVHSQDYTWKVSDIKSQLKPNVVMVSPVFRLKGFPFEARARLEVKSLDYVVYISLAYTVSTRSVKDVVNVPAVPAVVYTLKDPNNKDVPRNNVCYAIPKIALLYDKFYYEMALRHHHWLTKPISITISVQQLAAGKACISDVK